MSMKTTHPAAAIGGCCCPCKSIKQGQRPIKLLKFAMRPSYSNATVVGLLLVSVVHQLSFVNSFSNPTLTCQSNVFRQSLVPSHIIAPRSTSQLRMSVPTSLDTLTSGLASIARLPFGVTVSDNAKRLKEPESSALNTRLAILYDVENDNSCRLVRERISELDLVVDRVVPAASNSRVFVDASYEYNLPEGSEIPRMVVKSTDGDGEEKAIIGADDILEFLDETYAVESPSTEVDDGTKQQIVDAVLKIAAYLPALLRAGRGKSVCKAASASSTVNRPEKPLILYSYEGNQFCRLVREVLTELDLPYELRSAGKSSPRRAEMSALTGGSSQCPYLIDENVSGNVSMFESADIIRYLYKNYALWTPPNELLQSASEIVTPLLKPVYKVLAPLQAGSNGEDPSEYEADIAKARSEIEKEIASNNVVIYTYSLSPFCTEATELLSNLDVEYREISLGKEWIPGLIEDPLKRAALGEMTGQTSLPHVFVNGKSIGGLFSGTPGLVPGLEKMEFDFDGKD